MLEAKGSDLYAGGVAVAALVEKYSSPLYIYDAELVEERCRQLRSLLPDVDILYSLKANPNPSIVAFLSDQVFGADVSSLGELQTALRAGFPRERICFVGPSKSAEELAAAIESDIGCVIAESEEELRILDELAGTAGVRARVALRVNPAFDSRGSRLKMGGAPRQFGIDEENVAPLIEERARFKHLTIIGLHAYLGTRILDWNVVFRNTEEILKMACQIAERTCLELEFLDVGGGLGVPYFPGEHEFDLGQFAAAAGELFSHYRRLMPGTRFLMEMGRYLTADAGIYVAEVRYVKVSRGQKYVLLSGGMNHHQATTSLGSLVKHHFPIVVANKRDRPVTQQAFICGPRCTPNDVLGKSVPLPDVASGDLIAVLKSGAYGFTASPLEFISHHWPGEVLAYKGSDYLVRDAAAVFSVVQSQPVVYVKEEALATQSR
ncbi:MAG TPA: alanine racemase [Candidatus Angelobacter sp.]|nr:alanine racemase [Candidatus Angelobacter sp.]